MIRSLRAYCTVCKDDETSRPSHPSKTRKRRAPLAEVDETMWVEGGVVKEGPPTKKRQRPDKQNRGVHLVHVKD